MRVIIRELPTIEERIAGNKLVRNVSKSKWGGGGQ